MTRPSNRSRRTFLNQSAALLGASALPGFIGQASAQSELNVGFIYVGPRDDYGYNQSHAEGAAAVKAMEGVTVVEEENVPESKDVQNTMESMINFDGATLLFPHRLVTTIRTFSKLRPSIQISGLSIAVACGRQRIPAMSAPTSVTLAWVSI